MAMPPWSEKRIEWYQRAVEWNGMDRYLADMFCPHLPLEETVCDLGCGTGYIAMELARRGYDTTAFDWNPVTMGYLEQEKERQGLGNLTLRRSDWYKLPREPICDNMIMVFAGHISEELPLFLRFFRKRLLVIIRDEHTSHIQADGKPTHRHTNADQVEHHLRDGWKFQSRRLVKEFGQPFRSREECVEYLHTFGADAESPKSTIHQLVETGDPIYPLYLPYEKKMRLYIIER